MATETYERVVGALAGAELTRGVAIGRLVGFDDAGRPMIERSDAGAARVAARSIVPLDTQMIGQEVALLFEAGDAARPLVIGVLQYQPSPTPEGTDVEPAAARPIEVEADGQRIVLTGKEEVVLRCGKASIQLSSDGTIRIRGTNVLSRASATNRIRGGNVQIN